MKTTLLLCRRAFGAFALCLLVLAGCQSADKVGRIPGRTRLAEFGYRRVALPTVAIAVSCTDGAMTGAETNEVIAFMSQYFLEHDKVVIDNPLRADYIATVAVARNGALKVSDWTLVSATYRKNKIATDYYAAMWGDDFSWRRAYASFRFGGGYGYGYSGFGFDDFNPYGFSTGNCYNTFPSTPVYTTPPAHRICPPLPTYCVAPPMHRHPRPVTCPPAPYCPRPRPDDTSVVQTHPERNRTAEQLVYGGDGLNRSYPVSPYQAGGYGSGSGGVVSRASSRIYDSPQPDYSASRSSSADNLSHSGNSSARYDSPSPAYSPPSSSSSSELRVVNPPTQTYSSPEPTYTRSDPPPSYSPPAAPSYSPPSSPEPMARTQVSAN